MLDDRVMPDRAAVVVIDVQNDFCHPDGFQAAAGKDVSAADGAVDRLESLLSTARDQGVPIVFVYTTHGPDTDTPEWLGRRTGPPRPQSCQTGSWGAEFYRVRPEAGDHTVEKHRYSGFTGTGLADVLATLGRTSLLFCGVSTSTCVETSLRDAVCRDFLTTLVLDCCADYTGSAHDRAAQALSGGFGIVANSTEIMSQWAGATVSR